MEKNESAHEPPPLPNSVFLVRVFSDPQSRRVIKECDDQETLRGVYDELTLAMATATTTPDDADTLDIQRLILRLYQEGMTRHEATQELIGRQIFPSIKMYDKVERRLVSELKGYYTAIKTEQMGESAPIILGLAQTALTANLLTSRAKVSHAVAPWLKELDEMPNEPLEGAVTEFIASFSGVSNYLEFVDDPQITGPSALLIGHLTSETELNLNPEDEKVLAAALRFAREAYKQIADARVIQSPRDKQEELVMRILLGTADGANMRSKALYSELSSSGSIQLPTAAEANKYLKSAFLKMNAFRRHILKRKAHRRLPKAGS